MNERPATVTGLGAASSVNSTTSWFARTICAFSHQRNIHRRLPLFPSASRRWRSLFGVAPSSNKWSWSAIDRCWSGRRRVVRSYGC